VLQTNYCAIVKMVARGKLAETNRNERDSGKVNSPELRSFPSIAELTSQQGTGPITDVSILHGDFWPEDESIDEFLQTLHEWRGHKRLDQSA